MTPINLFKPWRTPHAALIAGRLCALILGAFVCGTLNSEAATYTVTSIADDGSPGTLRNAISLAEASPGADTITFDFGGGSGTITLTSRLDTIHETLVIDGRSEPNFVEGGAPVAYLEGSSTASASALYFSSAGAAGSRVYAIGMGGFDYYGISISATTDIEIQSCWIGLQLDGTTQNPNGRDGIYISNSINVVVGGFDDEDRNVIGYCDNGIEAVNGSQDIEIQNNFLGICPDGSTTAPNNGSGVYMNDVSNFSILSNVLSGNASRGIFLVADTLGTIGRNMVGVNNLGSLAVGNSIGGVELRQSTDVQIISNVISGNTGNGIYFQDGCRDHLIDLNIIGFSAAEDADLGNTAHGIRMDDAHLITISNCAIGGNSDYGIYARENSDSITISNCTIGLSTDGTNTFGNDNHGIYMDATEHVSIDGCTIVDNDHGIVLRNNSNFGTITNCHIGVNIAGDGFIPNRNSGIWINSTDTTTILNNVVGTNANHGIYVSSLCDGFTIQGNKVGTDITGSFDFGNTQNGIYIDNFCTDGLIGGTDAGEGNTISGNGQNGILLSTNIEKVEIINNIIGLSSDETTDLGNGFIGILTQTRCDSILIQGNTVSGNDDSGIFIQIDCIDARVIDNFVGTTSSGVGDFGNNVQGIHIYLRSNNPLIQGNIIGNNGLKGIYIETDCVNPRIYSNIIGTDINGDFDYGNGEDGIFVRLRSHDPIIGGPGLGNVIANNTENGIEINEYVNSPIIQSNYIGLDVTGRKAMGNGQRGIFMHNNVDGGQIGGDASERNYIADNAIDGIKFDQADNNLIQGNYIGTDVLGIKKYGNGEDGISLNNSLLNVIGGTGEYKNIIGNNRYDGITFITGSNDSRVIGNWIGLAPDGKTNFGNGWGTGSCIDIITSDRVDVGGCGPGEGNVLVNSIQNGAGIYIQDAYDCEIWGNFIGTDTSGTLEAGNSFRGISIYNVGTQLRIGTGADESCGNTIAFNQSDGIYLNQGSVDQIEARNNSFYGNQGIGINLNGAGNANMAAPTITSLTNCSATGTTATSNDTVDLYYDYGYGLLQGAVRFATVVASGTNWSYNGTIEGGSKIVAMSTSGNRRSSPFGDFPGQDLNDAGRDTTIYVCQTETSIDLFDNLAGIKDAGGTWNDGDATGALSGDVFNPSLVALGTYDFTYSVALTGGCTGFDEATITVVVGDMVEAGQGKSMLVCSSPNPINLMDSLSGNLTNSGDWVDADNSESLLDSLFYPGGLGGIYTVYFITGVGGCIQDTATFTIQVTDDPSAGSFGTTTICSTSGTINLFDFLQGSADHFGVWQDTPGTGALTDSILDPSGLTDGDYAFVYEVAPGGTCNTDTASVRIQVQTPPSVGSGTSFSLCSSTDWFVLTDSLSATTTTGGTWSSVDAPAQLQGDSVNVSALTTGPNTFTYTTPANVCGTMTEDIDITTITPPNAGSDNSTTLCNASGNTIDIATLVEGTADGGGSFSELTLSGGLTGSNYDPTGVPAADYSVVYVVSAVAACPNDTANFTVTVNDSVFAGNGSTIQVCINQGTVDLADGLTGSPQTGGIWSNVSGSGSQAAGVMDLSASGEGSHDFRYRVDANGVCPADSTDITVQVEDLPDAGRDSTLNLCINTGSYDLFDALTNQDANGTWVDLDATGALSGSTVDLSGLLGTYSFGHILAGTLCPQDTALIALTIVDTVFAGLSNTISTCGTGADFALLDSLPQAQTGGTWSLLVGSGSFTATDFQPTSSDTGWTELQYKVTSTTCPSDSASLTIYVAHAFDAGNDTSVQVCVSETAVEMNTFLTGQEQSGTWVDLDGHGGLTGSQLDASQNEGVYRMAHVIIIADCPSDSAIVTVNIQSLNNAGIDTTLWYCEASEPVSLAEGLSPTATQFGYWWDAQSTGALTGGMLDIGMTSDSTIFNYIDSTKTACLADSANYTIQSNGTVDAGPDRDTSVCEGTGLVELNDLLLSGDLSGSWFDHGASGMLNGSQVDLSSAGTGVYPYHYVLDGGACPSDSAQYQIRVQSSLSAGNDTSALFCSADDVVNLNAYLSSNDALGSWWDFDANSSSTSMFDPTGKEGVYALGHVIAPEGTCAGDTAIFSLAVSSFNSLGSGQFNYGCRGGEIDLDTLLTTQTVGWGTWSANSGAPIANGLVNTDTLSSDTLTAIYTISTAGSCGQAQDTLTLVITNSSSIADSLLMYCAGAVVVDMDAVFDFEGGTWLDSINQVVNATQDLTSLTGDYEFSHINTDGLNCSIDSTTLTIEIRDQPPVAVDTTITLGFDASAFDLNGLFPSLTTRAVWVDRDASGGLFGSQFVPANVDDGQDYLVQYIIANGCGSDTGNVTISVTIDCGTSSETLTEMICYNLGPIDLTPYASNFSDTTWQWWDAGTQQLSNEDTLTIAAGVSTYNLWFITDSINSCGSDTLNLNFLVTQAPVAGEDVDTAFCNDGSDLFLDDFLMGVAATTGKYYSAIAPFDEVADIISLDTSWSSLTLFYVATNSCASDTAVLDFTLYALPQVDAGASVTLNRGTSAQLNATVSGATQYSWHFDESISDTTLLSPTVTPTTTTTYTLSAETDEGCLAEDQVTATVEFILDIPEAFTPDNDGSNDVWELRNIDLYPDNAVRIYDRWGDLIFESIGYEEPWDGSFNGNPVPIGAYVFIVDLGEGIEPISGAVHVIR
jgi:gliding motility-associated-like protein